MRVLPFPRIRIVGKYYRSYDQIFVAIREGKTNVRRIIYEANEKCQMGSNWGFRDCMEN